MAIDHLSRTLQPDPGPGHAGGRPPAPSAAARTSTSPRRSARRARRSSAATAARATAPSGACGRARSRAATLDPFYARAERGLRVRRPTWKQVSKSGGLWAAALRRGRAHLRPRAAGDRPGALRGRQVVPHGLHLRRQELADHQLPRRAPRGSACRCGPRQVESVGSLGAARTATSSRARDRPDDALSAGGAERDRVQGADPGGRRDGRRADPDALARRAAVALEPARAAPGRPTATTSPRSSTTRARCAACSACPATASSTRASRSRR